VGLLQETFVLYLVRWTPVVPTICICAVYLMLCQENHQICRRLDAFARPQCFR